ncbi:MAG: segregation/condensation protein A [Mycoplasmataceae bacterium]|nr:segregation/condensation protein A [Mycoplasmataceae bacterium]
MSDKNDIKINSFNGPIDLLLELVKDKNLDLFDIDLSVLATEYVRIVSDLKDTDIDLASEYLVMAATLIQLKAKMLLDRPDEKVEVEKEKGDLLKQLIQHQQFKNVAKVLREKETSRKDLYIKSNEDYKPFETPQDEAKLDGKSDAVKLIMQMRKMFERVNAQQMRQTTITKIDLSPAERRLEIIEIMKDTDTPTFEALFTLPTLEHFAITMLTILDMARKQELIIEQDDQFGEIRFKKGVIND